MLMPGRWLLLALPLPLILATLRLTDAEPAPFQDLEAQTLTLRYRLRGPLEPSGAVSLVMMPVAHALSRANERSADRFALELTKNPGAFVSAMRRLGAQNLAEEAPSRITQWLFYSHPPLGERIAAAQRFGGSTGLVNSQSRVSH